MDSRGEARVTSSNGKGAGSRWRAGAKKSLHRNRRIGWKRERKDKRLRLVANNTRFIALGGKGAFPNLASFALAGVAPWPAWRAGRAPTGAASGATA